MDETVTTEELVSQSPDDDNGLPAGEPDEDIEPYAGATEAAEGWSDDNEEAE